jgi:hypothetical protein
VNSPGPANGNLVRVASGGKIWVGETLRRESGGRRLALGQRRIAAIDVGTTNTVGLNADRVIWIVSLSLQGSRD